MKPSILTGAMSPADAERMRELLKELRGKFAEIGEHMDTALAGAVLDEQQQAEINTMRQLCTVLGDDFLLGEVKANTPREDALAGAEAIVNAARARFN